MTSVCYLLLKVKTMSFLFDWKFTALNRRHYFLPKFPFHFGSSVHTRKRIQDLRPHYSVVHRFRSVFCLFWNIIKSNFSTDQWTSEPITNDTPTLLSTIVKIIAQQEIQWCVRHRFQKSSFSPAFTVHANEFSKSSVFETSIQNALFSEAPFSIVSVFNRISVDGRWKRI